MNTLDALFVAAYAAGLLAIAAHHARKLKNQDDVYLAGRSMSRWPVAISMYMAIFSTNTLLGFTGWVNRVDGSIWVALQTLGILLAVPLSVWLYPSLFFRLRITSAYEYLERRFNRSVCMTATALFLTSRVMWLSTMIYSASLVVVMMLGLTSREDGAFWAILAIGAVGTALALIGGMHAVIWTDVMQFFILLAGLIAMIVFGLQLSGGFGRVIEVGAEFNRFALPPAFSLQDGMNISGALLVGFVSMLASAGADQVILQTYLTSKSEREAKASLWRNGIFLKPLSFIYPFLGLIIFAYFQAHPDVRGRMKLSDEALPLFVVAVLPPGGRALMLIAIIAAVMTSVQSGLAAVSAAIQVNYLSKWIRGPVSDRTAVLIARGLLLASGAFIIVVAFWIRRIGAENGILQVLNIVMYPFTGVLLGIFLLGLLSRRSNGQGVMLGTIAGVVLTLVLPAARSFGSNIESEFIRLLGGISTFYYGFWATAVTCGVGYASSLLFDRPERSRIDGLTRWTLPPEQGEDAGTAVSPSLNAQ